MSTSAYVIYCEDIREEVDNQFSMIGCFKGHLAVDEFPCMVPKICAAVNWVQSLDEERVPIDIKVLYRHLDDGSIVILGEHSLPIDTASVESGAEMLIGGAHLKMSITLAKPGVFGVRLYRKGVEMRLRGLPFTTTQKAPASEA